ncbi:hypothetical protein HYPSUDRAFT_31485 [Hypholoma sublateritium FD-334 SS-4]|uniref:Structural maintenance of chromosomes protein 5 n=1 Tax=Hypholoma sublateritium (strain FD-334 SS-4) TaxID=945553 RepID=A0A0D2QD66_HYPSF|nr:hypothetical protein HYPSUDRAFT_31485 [Hypholoma sublateritium FD-334 SS-4]
MPRASSSAQPEGSRVKKEKIVVKEERSKGKRREQVEEVEEEEQHESQEQNERDVDAEGEEEEEEDSQSGSPRGSKRARINGDGDSVPSRSDSQPPLPRVKTQPRDVDSYVPGSIVRIQLSNFVTYDYVQFRPGPYLNMIIGPNGTGKSSIACAIALGLNFPPAVLGRSNEINAYVKNGTDTGYIEIELKGPKNKPNLVIRRNLNARSKTSTFTLNGQAASGREINLKMAELNVQVGNLCSFLPQDRVSEFAAMSSQQLLKETQLAAGDENLTNWHTTLIGAGQELKIIQQAIKDDEDSLKQMQDRNEGIERDVQRYKERKKIEHTINLLAVLIPVAEYRENRKRYLEIKGQQRTIRAKVQRLRDKNEPAHDRLKKYDQDVKNADNQREDLKKSTQKRFKKMSAKCKATDDLEVQSSEIVDKIASLKKEEKNRKKDIDNLASEISKLEAELEKPPSQDLPTKDELTAISEEIKAERQIIGTRREEFNYQMRSVINRKAGFAATVAAAEQDMKKLDNVDVQKLNAMRKWDQDTYDAIIWVRNNRHLFKMEVFETPFMRLSMKNRQFADAVESCFSATQMKSFVTQCQEDCDVINKHINDETAALGRKTRVTTWFRPYNENNFIAPPMSREELQQLRFDGYALDYVDFPEGMRWFLSSMNLHRTAVALNGSAIDVNQAMQLVARPMHNHSGGATFISGTTMNIVTRSRYGRKAVGNMTRDVQRARSLSAPTIDLEVKRQIDGRIRDARREMELCEEERIPLVQEIEKLDQRETAYNALVDKFKRKQDIIKKEATRLTGLRSRLDARQKNIKVLIDKPTAEKQSIKLREKLQEINQQRMQYIREFTDLFHAIIAEQQECTRCGLRYMQINNNRNAFKELCERKDAKYQTALVELNRLTEQFAQVKKETTLILDRGRVALDENTPEVKEQYKQIEKDRVDYETAVKEAAEQGLGPPQVPDSIDMRSSDELQAELETQRANLEMNLNTNPGVIEQYEKRKRDIEQLEKTLEGRKKKEEKVAKDIKNARDNWQPALQRLVDSIGQKFSAAFDRIGCAGEIRINENEDYDKWAIDILVKFRDSEKLQLLTAHRQSGGERSLTTILYLMSLTEEARAPFSLVDEINQGMDQRAERMVHNSMVGVTCKEESGQYFLITPKLLPDLHYDEKMKILVVNNGEWLPEEKDIGCMNDMIDLFLHAQRPGGGAASAM